MSTARFLVGCALLVVAVAPLVLAARRLQQRWIGATGALARLGEGVVALALLVVVLELAGTVGLFATGPVVVATAATGLVIAALSGRRARGTAPAPVPPPADRVATAAALGGAALVSIEWIARSAAVLGHGITDYDSLHYHLPHAARWVQDGWLTRLHFVSPDFPNAFHPENADLLHALGMLSFGRDVLSPALNLGWLGLLFLAAWCAGRPFGRAPAMLAAACLVAVQPVMLRTQPGTANNDVASLALLLASVAFLLHGQRFVGVAGLAAGLAAGTKLPVLPAVVLLTLVVVVVAGRGRARAQAAVRWTLPLLAASGFWYLRNLFRTGSPLPSMELGLGPLRFPAPSFEMVDRFGFSVADYLTDGPVWREWLLPGLDAALGPVWGVVGGLALAGVLMALIRGPRLLRLLGVVVILSAVAYVLTPTTASGARGEPGLFGPNLRYLLPALLLGLLLLVISPSLPGSWVDGLAPLSLALVAATWVWGDAGPAGNRLLGVVVLAASALAAWGAHRHPVLLLGAAALALILGLAAQRHYFEHRYHEHVPWAWASALRDRRIALSGQDLQYPLYGSDLSNHVQYVGQVTPHGGFERATSCAQWQRLLRAGDYDFLVVRDASPHDEGPWALQPPGGAQILQDDDLRVFRLGPGKRVDSCP